MRSVTDRIGPWAAAFLLASAFLLFALAGIYTVRQQNLVNDKLCEQTVENRAATRSTWLAAQTAFLRAATSEESRRRIEEFFHVVLITIPPLECVNRKPVEVNQ
jgi:hypothetical protein